jgi:hypothetical protein
VSDVNAVRVYVPDAVDDDIHARVRWYLSVRFGGVTSYDGRGSWIPDSERDKPTPDTREERRARMCTEDTTVYESVTDSNQPATTAKRAARMVKQLSDESAVLWEVRPVAATGME